MSEQQNFWSRRRAAVAAEEQAETAAVEANVLAQEHAALEDMPDEDILAELNLPEPDQMQMGDDFSVFMAKAVPDRIRRRALRTLWRTNPVLANVDMLVDYGEDFTDSANVIENLQTTYQVGKGMLKHVQEMARQAEEKERALSAATDEDAETGDEEDGGVLTSEANEADEEVEIAHSAPEPEPEEEEAYIAPTPRRMTFRTEETA